VQKTLVTSADVCHTAGMYSYRGKQWSEEDVERIRALIVASPSASRAQLAQKVCEAFDWRTLSGQLKAMCCRDAMLQMSRDGLFELPPPRNGHRRPSRVFASAASDPQPAVDVTLNELRALRLEPVAQGRPSALWNEYIARYHYLGYGTTLGAQLRYFLVAEGHLLGAMAFGGAAWKVAPRDHFIGWSAEQRQSRLHLVVNQTRFLILPWVRCQNLATKALALCTRRLPQDWRDRYGYRPVLLETFVDQRFVGTCYRAGNWLHVGQTQGRSRMDRHHKREQPIKSIWLLPLRRDFRTALQGASVSAGG
jgi:hypothetical protein